MADPVTPATPVETGAAGGSTTTQAAEAAGTAGSTPTPRAAEAATRESTAHEKQAFAARDQAKQEAAAAKAEAAAVKAANEELSKKLGEFEKATKAAADAALAEQGKFKELYEAQKAENEKLKADGVEQGRRAQQQTMSRELLAAYTAVGGDDPDEFMERAYVKKALADGTVKLDEKGQVTGHLDVVKRMAEAAPKLFKSAKDALAKAAAGTAGGLAGAGTAAAAALQNKDKPNRPLSLAEEQLGMGYTPRPSWRIPAKK